MSYYDYEHMKDDNQRLSIENEALRHSNNELWKELTELREKHDQLLKTGLKFNKHLN